MSIPFNLRDTAIQLIGQKKPADVSEIISRVKEHMKGAGPGKDALSERELAEAVRTRIIIHQLLKEHIIKDLSVIATGAKLLSREKQKVFDSAPADIICKDRDRNTVIAEIFVGEAGIDELAKTIDLMGSAAAAENAPVRGVLVAGGFTENALNAAKVIAKLRLLKYDYGFRIEEAGR